MVLTGVNVDHESFVDLARKYFVDVPTSWEGVEPKPVDQSVAQYTSYDVKVNKSMSFFAVFLSFSAVFLDFFFYI